MLVSFIIPSYNSAHTVRRCLDSIFALSFKPSEYEVIFVDDCSTDNTCEIVAEYQLQHSNIILLRQPENNRQGAARNRGVKVSKGEYISFVDSDDAATEGIVNAIRIAKANQTDMMVFHYGHANEQGVITKEAEKLRYGKDQLFTGIEMQNNYPYWCSGPFAYIYKRDFLEQTDYTFREGVLYEDSDFVAVHLYKAKRMTYSPELGYAIYYREGSTTHSVSYKNAADYLFLGVRMLRFYESIAESGKRKEEGEDKFAEGILEGACCNVLLACKGLVKLSGYKEVCLFYERVDKHIRREELSENKAIKRYYWSIWNTICLKHSATAKTLLMVMIPLYKLYKKVK